MGIARGINRMLVPAFRAMLRQRKGVASFGSGFGVVCFTGKSPAETQVDIEVRPRAKRAGTKAGGHTATPIVGGCAAKYRKQT